MANVLFIIAPSNFRDEELLEPKKVLESAGHTCTIASTTTDEATGSRGARVTPDIAFMDVSPREYDAVIVVGGSGARELAHVPPAMNIISVAADLKKVIGAICIAPILLAKAGLLNGKRVTVFYSPDSYAVLQSAGALVQGEPGRLDDVVTDGKIVTARGPDVARQFGEAVAKLL